MFFILPTSKNQFPAECKYANGIDFSRFLPTKPDKVCFKNTIGERPGVKERKKEKKTKKEKQCKRKKGNERMKEKKRKNKKKPS